MLILGANSNPGSAFWAGDPWVVAGDTTLLTIALTPASADPTLDPAGRTSICFSMDDVGAFSKNVVLPVVTSSLPAAWRFTIGALNVGSTMVLSAAPGNTIANAVGPGVTLRFVSVTALAVRPTSATLIHDNVATWAVFYGGLTEFTG